MCNFPWTELRTRIRMWDRQSCKDEWRSVAAGWSHTSGRWERAGSICGYVTGACIAGCVVGGQLSPEVSLCVCCLPGIDSCVILKWNPARASCLYCTAEAVAAVCLQRMEICLSKRLGEHRRRIMNINKRERSLPQCIVKSHSSPTQPGKQRNMLLSVVACNLALPSDGYPGGERSGSHSQTFGTNSLASCGAKLLVSDLCLTWGEITEAEIHVSCVFPRILLIPIFSSCRLNKFSPLKKLFFYFFFEVIFYLMMIDFDDEWKKKKIQFHAQQTLKAYKTPLSKSCWSIQATVSSRRYQHTEMRLKQVTPNETAVK